MSTEHQSTNQSLPTARVAVRMDSTSTAVREIRAFEAPDAGAAGAAYFIQGHRVSADEMRAAMRRLDAAQAAAECTSDA